MDLGDAVAASSAPPQIAPLSRTQIDAILKEHSVSKAVSDWIWSTYDSGLPAQKDTPALHAHTVKSMHFIFDVLGKEKHKQHAAQCLQQLAESHPGGEAVQGRTIGQIYGRLTGYDSGLPQQILCIVDKEKVRCVDASIVALHENCMQANLKPEEQMAHLQSAYLAKCGEELGLSGSAASKLDSAAPTLTDQQCHDFLDEFRQQFDIGLVIDNVVYDVNQIAPDQRLVDIDVLMEWCSQQEDENFDKQSIWYNPDNASQYKLTGPPPANSPASDLKAPWIHRDVVTEIMKRCFEAPV